MKTIGLIIILTLATFVYSGPLAESPILVEGGETSDTGLSIFGRWPVFQSYGESTITVEITYPEDGEEYYINTFNTTANISEPAQCFYKIDDGLWNNYNCSGIECGQRITFHQGHNVFTVYCENGLKSGSDSISFDIYMPPGALEMGMEEWLIILLPLILSFTFLYLDGDAS